MTTTWTNIEQIRADHGYSTEWPPNRPMQIRWINAAYVRLLLCIRDIARAVT